MNERSAEALSQSDRNCSSGRSPSQFIRSRSRSSVVTRSPKVLAIASAVSTARRSGLVLTWVAACIERSHSAVATACSRPTGVIRDRQTESVPCPHAERPGPDRPQAHFARSRRGPSGSHALLAVERGPCLDAVLGLAPACVVPVGGADPPDRCCDRHSEHNDQYDYPWLLLLVSRSGTRGVARRITDALGRLGPSPG